MKYLRSQWSFAIGPPCMITLRQPVQCGVRAASTAAGPIHLNYSAIDKKWQERWQRHAHSDRAKPDEKKAYILPMFPYPSGNLHMGHLRVYTIADVLARYKRMQGYNILQPMGWDAFGLPAENAAIERGIDPAVWTKDNVARMKEQLIAINGGMDWSREFMTCDPSFYKHTQRLFLLLLEHGLAYQAESLVNYDPIDRTVLANEQVDSNGFSWRSGAKVEQRSLRQWFLRITAFREELLADLDLLEQDKQWPERVLAMQRNWIGRSKGAKFRFQIVGADNGHGFLQVFTTRPDTLFGAQFLAVSASHPLVASRLHIDPDLNAFIDNIPSLPPDSKLGYKLPGVAALNPLYTLSDSPPFVHESLPIFVASYVLEGYGESAVMGVPGHDNRDYAFWKQNMAGESVRVVICSEKSAGEVMSNGPNSLDNSGAFTPPGILAEECGSFTGLPSQEAGAKIVERLSNSGNLAESSETWRLRDWLISRQRYWGTPIPIVHCTSCGAVPVPADQLPVKLPRLEGHSFRERTGNPLETAEEWLNTTCPKCHGAAKRDTDTMDTFVDSSWYFMRFPDAHNTAEPFSKAAANASLPVDTYIGGVEHAILHLLYARFISKFAARTGLWPAGNDPAIRGEPFRKLISQGMVHGKTYSDPRTKRFLKPNEVDLSDTSVPRVVATGELATISYEKMSKSKYNGVDPGACIGKYGADVTRAHILFQAPVIDVLEWEEARIVGMQRWFARIWRVVEYCRGLLSTERSSAESDMSVDPEIDPSTLSASDAESYHELQKSIRTVTAALEHTQLNTLISDLIKLTNVLHASPPTSLSLAYRSTSTLLRLIAPVAPAFAEECWEVLHHFNSPPSGQLKGKSIFDEDFPVAGQLVITLPTQTCSVQENGKLRFALEIPTVREGLVGKELEGWVLDRVKESDEGAAWLERKKKERVGEGWRKVVVVRGGKTVNFVG